MGVEWLRMHMLLFVVLVFFLNNAECSIPNVGGFVASISKKQNEFRVRCGRRRLLDINSNLPAASVVVTPLQNFVNVPSFGTGSFPAIPSINSSSKTAAVPIKPNNPLFQDSPTNHVPPTPFPAAIQSATSVENQNVGMGLGKWVYAIIPLAAIILIVVIGFMVLMGRSQEVATIGPWKTGLSCQLQKAFVSGVPKLQRAELEAACEDFSNVIHSYPDFTVFKGTLSSGVEIAVASSIISSSADWSRRAETHFRKKVDTLSRVNHKNFVNLLGYCEEDQPFMRMMVFEYATNGTLSEHLHVKEYEPLEWGVRMRIIMGITYCLQYMHHQLNPPVSHPNLQSSSICLTEDYAAKIAEMDFWKEVVQKKKFFGEDDRETTETPSSDSKSNVYDFGVLLLEIISGKPSYSVEQGSIMNWASEYLNDKSNSSYLVDPMLQSFKNNELDVIFEVIQDCVNPDPNKRPTVMEIAAKLREVLAISPESAVPRLSPLWWAELEILSVEAT